MRTVAKPVSVPRIPPPKNGHFYVALIAGGKKAFVDKGVRPHVEKTFGFQVVEHRDYDYPRQWASPIPRDVDVVILLADMAGVQMQGRLKEVADQAGVVFVRGMRKWATLHECILRAGFQEQKREPEAPRLIASAAPPPLVQKPTTRISTPPREAEEVEELKQLQAEIDALEEQEQQTPPEETMPNPPQQPPQQDANSHLSAALKLLASAGLDEQTITVQIPGQSLRISKMDVMAGQVPEVIVYAGKTYVLASKLDTPIYREARVVSAFRL